MASVRGEYQFCGSLDNACIKFPMVARRSHLRWNKHPIVLSESRSLLLRCPLYMILYDIYIHMYVFFIYRHDKRKGSCSILCTQKAPITLYDMMTRMMIRMMPTSHNAFLCIFDINIDVPKAVYPLEVVSWTKLLKNTIEMASKSCKSICFWKQKWKPTSNIILVGHTPVDSHCVPMQYPSENGSIMFNPYVWWFNPYFSNFQLDKGYAYYMICPLLNFIDRSSS